MVSSISPASFTADDRTLLYLGAANTLYYPNAAMDLGSCRAYFRLKGGLTAGDKEAGIRAFNQNFDGDDVTGIEGIVNVKSSNSKSLDAWFTLDGRRLNSKPSQAGVYVYKGIKVVVK